jgi:hypothetical protein
MMVERKVVWLAASLGMHMVVEKVVSMVVQWVAL